MSQSWDEEERPVGSAEEDALLSEEVGICTPSQVAPAPRRAPLLSTLTRSAAFEEEEEEEEEDPFAVGSEAARARVLEALPRPQSAASVASNGSRGGQRAVMQYPDGTQHTLSFDIEAYKFGPGDLAKWIKELNEVYSNRGQADSKQRFQVLRQSLRDWLYEIERKFLSSDDPHIATLDEMDRVRVLLGMTIDVKRDINWEMFRTRTAFVRKVISEIVNMAYRLKLYSPIAQELRSDDDIRCERIIMRIPMLIENAISMITMYWQRLYLTQKKAIEGSGVPSSIEYWNCGKMDTPKQRFIEYIKQCILRQDWRVTHNHQIYAPIHIHLGAELISTRHYVPLRFKDNSIMTLDSLVYVLSSNMYDIPNIFKDHLKFDLGWSFAHSNVLQEELSKMGRGLGDSLGNELTTYFKKNYLVRHILRPRGTIYYGFKNGVIQVTPTVRFLDYKDMTPNMECFHFIDQDIRPEVIEIIADFADLQQSFIDGTTDSETFLEGAMCMVGALRELSSHLEGSFEFQNWEEGTIHAFYAFGLPQMVCRRHWNHTNTEIAGDRLHRTPNGLMVILVGITGSGKTVMTDLIDFCIPEQHRLLIPAGGQQKEFPLTQLADNPNALYVTMPDIRESAKTFPKELFLQMMQGGFAYNSKFKNPLIVPKENCMGIIGATNDLACPLLHDDFSEGGEFNASERRCAIFILNNSYIQESRKNFGINSLVQAQSDSFVATSFVLFNAMRNLFPNRDIYDLICGANEDCTPIFGAQLATFRRNINNVGDTFRKLFLVSGMFVCRANTQDREEDNVISVPMSVLHAIVAKKLKEEGKQTIYKNNLQTYLNRIFNTSSKQPILFFEEKENHMWRGKRYTEYFVFGLTISYKESIKPFRREEELHDLQMRNEAEYEDVVANIRMHMEELPKYDKPLETYITKYVMKTYSYMDDGSAAISSSSIADTPVSSSEFESDSFCGFMYPTFLNDWKKWCLTTCYGTKAYTEIGSMYSEANRKAVVDAFTRNGWPEVKLVKKRVVVKNVLCETYVLLNVISPFDEHNQQHSSQVGIVRRPLASAARKRHQTDESGACSDTERSILPSVAESPRPASATHAEEDTAVENRLPPPTNNVPFRKKRAALATITTTPTTSTLTPRQLVPPPAPASLFFGGGPQSEPRKSPWQPPVTSSATKLMSTHSSPVRSLVSPPSTPQSQHPRARPASHPSSSQKSRSKTPNSC